MILLDELLDEGTYRVVDWTPVAAIVPEHGREDEIVTRLSSVPHLTVFRRGEVPARLHYNDNPRIQPVLAMADDGWQITSSTRARARASLGGDHGYDNAAANMGALFVAAGPAFSQGVVVDRVRTLDLYELMCRVLGIDPSPNDGALDSIAAVLRP
jgi:ectonucleotide pyrophosphatase/phosphodiesterase family protein 5